MSWNLIDAKTRKLTAALAREFATMTPAPDDRPLSDRRIDVYRRLVNEGSFRPCTWARATCLTTGEVFRVNGKHTSSLFSQMESLPDLVIVVETYECDTVEDVARLYATFDSRMQTRTTSDINRAFAATVPELLEVPQRTINLAVSSLSYFKWRAAYTSIPAAERAELLLDQVEFALWLSELVHFEGRQFRHIARGPVAAAMFATWLKSRKDATAFWCAVRDETGETPQKADRKLSRFLLTMNVAGGTGGKAPASRRASHPEFYAKCIHAWNAWRRGETTDLKYYADAKVPDAK